MTELWTLLILCLAMLIGCFLAGILPLAIPFSESKLRKVTILGAGLLVGTALVVIIPEGVHAILTNAHSEHHGDHVLVRKLKEITMKPAALPLHKQDTPIVTELKEDHEHHQNLHTHMGLPLILGFVLMLLIDQLASTPSSSENPPQNRNKITATLGLVVHAAVDGIALGAAASTSQTQVEMIVFVAIMLHKAPASFGLVSFLLHEGMDRNRIRRHLSLFSAAAPIMALLTYFALGQSSKEALASNHVTGLAMLFSGGTFLYVATVHILPQLNSAQSSAHQHTHFTFTDLLCVITGCLAPLFLSFGHHH